VGAKQTSKVRVRVYTNKQRLNVWCCAVLGAKQVCKANKPSKGLVYLTTKSLVFGAVCGCCAKQRLNALFLCWSILQPSAKLSSKGLVSCRVLSKGVGLSYNQRFGYGAVGGCGAGLSYIQALAWCLV